MHLGWFYVRHTGCDRHLPLEFNIPFGLGQSISCGAFGDRRRGSRRKDKTTTCSIHHLIMSSCEELLVAMSFICCPRQATSSNIRAEASC